jgi:hypothetical protein
MRHVQTVLVLTALAGCGGNNNMMGPCMPGAAECVNEQVARVCASDNTWVSEPCQAGSTCMNGMCVAKTDVACKPTDSTCMDTTHALVCNTNGVGFMSVSCPMGTVCQGNGVCVGTCIVGSSKCVNASTTATCMDGFNYVESACMPGMTSCVTTTAMGASVPAVACMPMGCPASGTVTCGNKLMDPNSTDPNFSSSCVASPSGLHWQVEQCVIAGTCVPGVGCSPTCTPGAMRCAPGSPGASLGIQTCGMDGKWGASVACNAPNTAAQVCMLVNSAPVCGDLLCVGSSGACESDGYHPCVNGKVSTTAMPCAMGVCVATGTASAGTGGYTPGSCQAQCAPGDQRCDGTSGVTAAYQTCVNGRWSSTPTNCAANKCLQYNDPTTNGLRTVCGVCVPGTHRCTDNMGVVGGTTDIETCDPTGAWGAHTACAAGSCQFNGVSDFACLAQCVPGSTVCVGTAPVPAPNALHPGTIAAVVCNQNGTLPPVPLAGDCAGASPPASCCLAGTSCRKSVNGQPIGMGTASCVQCVGPSVNGGNEYGLVDTMCPTATSESVCTANNTWPATATTCTTSCTTETNGGTCFTCFGTAPTACSNSAFMAHGLGTCGTSPCGGTPDCCLGECSGATAPTPSVCQ